MSKRSKLRANRDLPTKLVRLRTRCDGKRHVVLYRPGGPLDFTDHTHKDLKRKLRLVELGGEPCGCVKVLLAWRRVVVDRDDRVKLPVALIPAAREAICLCEERL